ncbi:MAG: AAA family ATPase [Candidatus Omnitrophica bacterium]|nr:AAA family ATPase [Candidatus Omnitrophota bacterium]
MIIGLTGPNASGKGEVARYLLEKGFIYHSLSDILREEGKKLDIEPLRENLITLGNRMRQEKGPAILALCAIKKLSDGKNHVVDSIRNPAEIEALRGVRGFVLLGLDAPVEIRFKRGLARKRPGDALTLEEFIKKEEKENRSSAENQQLKKCLEMADAVIANDSSIKELYKKIDETIKKA